MTSERKFRFWLANLAFGVASSILLQGIGYWFPLLWPGMFLALGVTVLLGQSLSAVAELWLVLAGNMLFYTWIFSRIVRAEITARGHLSRYFLQ
jgi:hypothetical protein